MICGDICRSFALSENLSGPEGGDTHFRARIRVEKEEEAREKQGMESHFIHIIQIQLTQFCHPAEKEKKKS